jgi:serine phosphatase RsbU (regulator of sigma subunit)
VLIERAGHDGKPFTDELRMTLPDGTLRELVIFGEPVADAAGPAGHARKLWGVIQDITEIRVAQRSAEKARADWQAEHRVLELLQQAMLPAELPSVPRAHLATTYLAATDRLDIGGDWYDVFRLPDGRILLSVGDVSGHDQQAAATMGPIRTALRAYAVENPDPANALSRLNRFLAYGYPKGTLITAVVAVYDPETCQFTWANAGHPAPLLLTARADNLGTDHAGAHVRVLAEHGPVLGAVADASYAVASVTLPAGAALCCYTDGLVERRGSTGDKDHARLLRTISHAFADVVADRADPIPPAARLVERLTVEMLALSPPEDDVCVLALWTLPAAPVRQSGPADEVIVARDTRVN